MNPEVRFGKPSIAGTRMDVATVVGLIAAGETIEIVASEYQIRSDDDQEQSVDVRLDDHDPRPVVPGDMDHEADDINAFPTESLYPFRPEGILELATLEQPAEVW